MTTLLRPLAGSTMPAASAMAAVLVLLGCLATPLAAQTAPQPNPTIAADRTQLVACLRQSGAAAMTACIGSVAVACVGSTGIDRRAAESACARREEAVWRERLTLALQATGRPLDASRRSRLAALHLAWEGYVAQKCAFYGASQPAALQSGRQAGCELREVANRAIELERTQVQPPPQRAPQSPPQIFR